MIANGSQVTMVVKCTFISLSGNEVIERVKLTQQYKTINAFPIKVHLISGDFWIGCTVRNHNGYDEFYFPS